MNKRFLTVALTIFCLCAGSVWAQKSISNVYKVNVIMATNLINPETTCMLYIPYYGTNPSQPYGNYKITHCDGTSVNWSPIKSRGEIRGVIISSSVHTLAGTWTKSVDTGKTERRTGLQEALNRAAQTVMGNLKRDDSYAIVGLTNALDRETAQFVEEELEVILVNNRFVLIDRNTLDKIRKEQQFQLSGDVDEDTAVSIGKFAGAKAVITGSITTVEGKRYLRLRVLDSQTARVVAAASEAL